MCPTDYTIATLQVDGLLAMAAYEPVNAYYLALKSSVCCEAGGYLFVQWICITCSAMLAWLACFFAMMLLRHLDQLPCDNCEYPRWYCLLHWMCIILLQLASCSIPTGVAAFNHVAAVPTCAAAGVGELPAGILPHVRSCCLPGS